MPNKNDQKRSVLSNVEVMQKFQMSKGRSKRTHTWRSMDGVSAMDKTSTTKMVLMTTTLNVALTLQRPWLGCKKGEATRFAHLPLFSLSLLVTSLWTPLYLWTMDGTHTHTMCYFSFFLSFCFCLIGSISFIFLLVHFKTW
jgi:hypothetical protein